MVGIGFKSLHCGELIETRPPVGWLEAHPENYMVAGGPRLAQLETVRADYPLSLHAVGLSLGSTEPVDPGHLARLRRLIDRFEPILVSDHLSWSGTGGVLLPDLLPLPYTDEALDVLCDNVGRVQDTLRRPILVENPSLYLRPASSTMTEAEFLGALAGRSGCGILLDVNNLHVSTTNLGGDAEAYLAALPAGGVGEIHLAGHKAETIAGTTILIDDHGSTVAPPVWTLYQRAVDRFGPLPTLIEWDTDVPPLETLVTEAAKAAAILGEIAPDREAKRHERAA